MGHQTINSYVDITFIDIIFKWSLVYYSGLNFGFNLIFELLKQTSLHQCLAHIKLNSHFSWYVYKMVIPRI